MSYFLIIYFFYLSRLYIPNLDGLVVCGADHKPSTCIKLVFFFWIVIMYVLVKFQVADHALVPFRSHPVKSAHAYARLDTPKLRQA